MNLFQALSSLIESVVNLEVVVAIAVGLLASYFAWTFTPSGVDRATVAAVTFVAVVILALLAEKYLQDRQ